MTSCFTVIIIVLLICCLCVIKERYYQHKKQSSCVYFWDIILTKHSLTLKLLLIFYFNSQDRSLGICNFSQVSAPQSSTSHKSFPSSFRKKNAETLLHFLTNYKIMSQTLHKYPYYSKYQVPKNVYIDDSFIFLLHLLTGIQLVLFLSWSLSSTKETGVWCTVFQPTELW